MLTVRINNVVSRPEYLELVDAIYTSETISDLVSKFCRCEVKFAPWCEFTVLTNRKFKREGAFESIMSYKNTFTFSDGKKCPTDNWEDTLKQLNGTLNNRTQKLPNNYVTIDIDMSGHKINVFVS